MSERKRYLYDEKENKIKSVQVVDDIYVEDPRTRVFDNLTHMAIWWNRCHYGDRNEFNHRSADDYVHDLLTERVSEDKIWDYVHKGFADIKVRYDKSKKRWVLYWIDNENEERVICEGRKDEIMLDVIDSLSIRYCWNLLEKYADIFCMPVYGYEHGGITFSVSDGYPYNDRFDGGQAGFVWVDKNVVMDNLPTVTDDEKTVKTSDENWKKAAEKVIRDEMKVYDMFLQGDVYGIVIEEMNEYGEFSHSDSCYGFYSDEYGNNLVKSLAGEIGYDQDLYDDLESCISDHKDQLDMADLDMNCMVLSARGIKRSELKLIADAFSLGAGWMTLQSAKEILKRRFGECGTLLKEQFLEAARRHDITVYRPEIMRDMLTWQ